MDLKAQVARLQKAPNPLLAQQAVLGIFHLISQQDQQLDLASLRPVLEPCLSHSYKASSYPPLPPSPLGVSLTWHMAKPFLKLHRVWSVRLWIVCAA